MFLCELSGNQNNCLSKISSILILATNMTYYDKWMFRANGKKIPNIPKIKVRPKENYRVCLVI